MNVAGGDTTDELGELEAEDDELALIAIGGGKTGELGKLENDELELVAATGNTTDKLDVFGGEHWPSPSA